MPEGKNKVVVFDQEQTGFAVNITQKGTMSYVIVYRDAQGIQRQEKLAGVGGISANAARAMAKARLAEVSLTKGLSLPAQDGNHARRWMISFLTLSCLS